jgi:hypothetical protein
MDATFKKLHRDERGVSFMAVMIVTLMVGVLGVAALTMSGLENSMAGAMRMVEEGADAAESCIGMGVKVIQQTVPFGSVPSQMVAPSGPVPAGNAAFLGQEFFNEAQANSPDVAFGAGLVAPNLVMTVNNYAVNGDIDLQFRKHHAGTQGAMDIYFRIDCQAQNAATGAASHVIAVYQCLVDGVNGSLDCTLRNI